MTVTSSSMVSGNVCQGVITTPPVIGTGTDNFYGQPFVFVTFYFFSPTKLPGTAIIPHKLSAESYMQVLLMKEILCETNYQTTVYTVIY